ncbi:hypothetical protein [Serratia nevei]|uniref:hypothetical protein n=1 Tax=Serratia nevei TaxID=2703794 RepID=UPI003FA71631
MKMKICLLLIGSLMLSAPLAQAKVTIGGEEMTPGGYTMDKDGNLIPVGQGSINGQQNGNGQSSATNNITKDIFSSLCASPFMKKYAAVCQ